MKLIIFPAENHTTVKLQGISGYVKGTPAGELRTGDTMVWNNGVATKVGKILKETDKTVTVEDCYVDFNGNEQVLPRKMNKNRIVARPASEL